MQKIQIQLKLDQDMLDALTSAADAENIPRMELIRRAIQRQLDGQLAVNLPPYLLRELEEYAAGRNLTAENAAGEILYNFLRGLAGK